MGCLVVRVTTRRGDVVLRGGNMRGNAGLETPSASAIHAALIQPFSPQTSIKYLSNLTCLPFYISHPKSQSNYFPSVSTTSAQ
jgi:hypothetical protein